MDIFFSNKSTQGKEIIIPSGDVEEFQRKEYALIEFIKFVKKDPKLRAIVALAIDEESHTLSIFAEKK